MPLAPLFKDRIAVMGDTSLPERERAKIFEAPLSEYVSPPMETRDLEIPGTARQIPARLYRPAGNSEILPGLIWFHGGGFRFGDIDMNEADIVARELAHRTGLVVLTVDYALVTETEKFPVPMVDGIDSLRWFAANAAELKVDAERIFVGGISAGGALAASVAVNDRDSGDNLLAGQLLNCPDLHRELPEWSDNLKACKEEEPYAVFFNHDLIAHHHGELVDPTKPVPDWWFAGDVTSKSGLAPTQIIDCEYDGLRASGEKYAADLKAAGVDVESLMQKGVPHAHINRYPADCPEMDETLNNMVRWIKAH
jgi:acetyl esterase/lipase